MDQPNKTDATNKEDDEKKDNNQSQNDTPGYEIDENKCKIMASCLSDYQIDVLVVIGGDGTLQSTAMFQQWVLEMRQQIKETYSNEYMLARGGRNNMTQADWGRVGAMVKRQYRYADGFARDIDAGKVSGGQIRTRARMYVDSATQAFERAKTESLGLPVLPAYPGDGQTVCRANCQCHWEIADVGDHWEATWQLGVAEHCPDCVQNAEQWAPLVVPK